MEIDSGIKMNGTFDGMNDVQLGKGDVRRLSKYEKIVAIVAYDEPTELQPRYAAYALTVNGVVQPGGGTTP
ncbi:MAG TPA: hypothetical protein VGR62_10875 [Candidatus Binatia bacterium]|nr:hypothetical protein [Candidatus Binatia bacterium]